MSAPAFEIKASVIVLLCALDGSCPPATPVPYAIAPSHCIELTPTTRLEDPSHVFVCGRQP